MNTQQLFKKFVGKRIRYSGDISNAPREGIATDLLETRWGTELVVMWDDDFAQGWDEDGTAVYIAEPVSRISIVQNELSGRFELI